MPKSNEDASISRSAMYAAWASTAISLVALGASIYAIVLSINSEQEVVTVTHLEAETQIPTEVIEADYPVNKINIVRVPKETLQDEVPKKTLLKAGVVPTYWRVFISNNGKKDVSIIKHRVDKLRGTDIKEGVYFGNVSKGLYSSKKGQLKPLNVPILITQGSTVEAYVKVDLLMNSSSYNLIKEYLKKEPITINEIERLLELQGTDFYGNKSKNSSFPFIIKDVPIGQRFVISFETARKTKTTTTFSLYQTFQ